MTLQPVVGGNSTCEIWNEIWNPVSFLLHDEEAEMNSSVSNVSGVGLPPEVGKSFQIEAAVIVMSVILAIIVAILAAIKLLQITTAIDDPVGQLSPPIVQNEVENLNRDSGCWEFDAHFEFSG